MKGTIISYGGMIAILIVTTIAFIGFTAGEDIDRTIITKEGELINFVNEVDLFIKSFDQSIYFISQRAAYDLGKTGGIDSQLTLWDQNYPKMDVLKQELEKRIRENFPKSRTEKTIEIKINDADIEISEDENYFYVNGNVYINFFDNSLDTRISVNHEIDSTIKSNYFKLLKAGRTIFEDQELKDNLNNWGALVNMLNSRYKDEHLAFSGRPIEDNIIEISIREYCYPSDFYCIAPLKPDETGLLGSIPYDYVELKLRYDKEQTGFTDLDFDFMIIVTPDSGSAKVICP